MKKEYVILLVLLFFCIIVYNTKREIVSIQEGGNFVIDTTLQREYEDVKFIKDHETSHTSKVIVSAKAAFERVKPSVNSLIQEGIIGIQDSFRIRLVNDSIWIIKSEPVSETGKLQFGGAVYYEIRKVDGYILKSVIEE